MRINYIFQRLFNMNYKSMFERVDTVSKKCSKNKFFIFCDMVWCGIRYGAGYVDYDVIGFYKLSSKQRKTMLTRGINDKYVKALNMRDAWHFFDNKNEFNEMFAKFVTRDWIYPVKDNKESVIEWMKKHDVFIAKPNDGLCGRGIEKIKVSDFDNDFTKLYAHLLENKLELLEEVILQHPDMNRLHPNSVNTCRVVTVMNDKGKVTILAAFVRIGNGRHVDNFNNGGMVADVDIDTGVIKEAAVDKAGNVYDRHPMTDTEIRGFKLPYWEKAKSMVTVAAKMSKNIRYVGWDVAFMPNGVTLIEGNQFPGHDAYQVAEKIGKDDIGVLPRFKDAIGF